MASEVKTNKVSPATGTGITMGDTGDTFTFPSGVIVTNSGTSTGFGATNNIQRATGDVTIATTANYDVDGKSAVIVSANAASENRTITLCPVGETGMDACVITVICDADATSTYELKVQDSSATEVWTGFQKGDFVQLVVSNSAWLVVDHKETMFSSRTFTSDLSIAASATVKPTGYTNVIDIGQVWDDTNNKLVAPFAGFWDLNWRLSVGAVTASAFSPDIYVGGAVVYYLSTGSDAGGYQYGVNMASLRVKVAASTDIEFYVHNIYSSAARVLGGNASAETGFDGTFTRTY